jgi:short-subunit dehydrogenase
MKEWVLITGGSTGIGLELGKVFAAHGYNLILTSRHLEKLQAARAVINCPAGQEIKLIADDLESPEAAGRIFDQVKSLQVGILVNNAGFGYLGSFHEEPLDNSCGMMRVNMESLVRLTHLFLPQMLERRSGRILNVASTAAFQPGPFTAIYYATKAFVFSFSLALSEELRGTGVTATVLCPGVTETEFFERARMRRKGIPAMLADTVARTSFQALMSGRPVCIPGIANKITASVSRRLPPRFTAGIIRRINQR